MEFKKLNDQELEQVVGGAASYKELKDMVRTCPFCLYNQCGSGIADRYQGRATGWMSCPVCGRRYEVYGDETAVYENATDIYTKRWIDKGGNRIETEGFADVQALWV